MKDNGSLIHEVLIQMSFSSAHLLRNYVGKCANLHGHNYKVEVHARGSQLDTCGMLIDFGDLKAATRKLVDYLDHQYINELPPFDEINPTAEQLAAWFLREVGQQVNNDRVTIYKVRIWETDNCVATCTLG
jgi:6-pyruvoyltetrahydropterin/6-carboxytetrahydropterin synthase